MQHYLEHIFNLNTIRWGESSVNILTDKQTHQLHPEYITTGGKKTQKVRFNVQLFLLLQIL